MNRRGKLSRGETCLVTGGAGFIGSHVAKELLQASRRVVCLDNLAGGYPENIPQGALFVRGDINDAALLSGLFDEYRFDYVFHFGAFAAEGLSHWARSFTFRNNQCGTATLINSAVKSGSVRGFVFASSVAVYGKAKGLLSEQTPPTPCDPYGISKMASELDLRSASEMFGLPFIIFRLHNVYGERQNLADPFRNVVGIFLRQLLEGKKLPIIGKGAQSRQFSHVSQVARVVARSIDVNAAYGEVFNVGAEKSYTIVELGRRLSKVAGRNFDAEYLPARNEAAHPTCSHAKARKVFGKNMTSVPLEAGLRGMYEWALKAPRLKPSPGPTIEIEKGLPAHWRKELCKT